MTFEIGFFFALLAAMVWLFLTEKLPVDLTAFLGLVILIFGCYLTPAEAFTGFSSPAVITWATPARPWNATTRRWPGRGRPSTRSASSSRSTWASGCATCAPSPRSSPPRRGSCGGRPRSWSCPT